jgi:hypothetical protein
MAYNTMESEETNKERNTITEESEAERNEEQITTEGKEEIRSFQSKSVHRRN